MISDKERFASTQVRLIALFEAAKGVLVLVTGFGLLLYIHRDLHAAGEQLVRHLHLNPARRFPGIFIDAIGHLQDPQLTSLALLALLYASARLAEAYGLWFGRAWAEWMGVLTGGAYLLVELYELHQRVTALKLAIIALNVAVVVVLLRALRERGAPEQGRR